MDVSEKEVKTCEKFQHYDLSSMTKKIFDLDKCKKGARCEKNFRKFSRVAV